MNKKYIIFKFKIWGLLCLIVLGGLVLVSCEKNKNKLVLAEVTHSIFYTPQYLAISLDYFKDEGLEIDLINSGGADKVMSALLSNEAQFGLSGPEATIYVYQGNQNEYMVNIAQLTKRDGSFIIGRTNEPFTLHSLKGKEILGGRVGGVPEMTLEYVIKEAGLTLGRNTNAFDVNVRTDVQFNAMVGAFVSGTSDYVTAFEPSGTAVEKAGQGYVLESVGKYSGLVPYTSYYVNKSYLEKNPEIVEKFVRAIYRAQVYLFTHTDTEVAEIIHPHFLDTSVEDLAKCVKRYREADVWCETPFFAQAGFERLMDIMTEANELTSRVPYDKLVDNTIVNRILTK